MYVVHTMEHVRVVYLIKHAHIFVELSFVVGLSSPLVGS